MNLKVSGHEDDDHQCAAVTHACGEVAITSFAAILYAISHVPSRVISVRRRSETNGTNAKGGAESQCKRSYSRSFLVIQSPTSSVTLSMKVTNVTHSIVQYLANFASGFARVITIYTRWKKARSIFVGM